MCVCMCVRAYAWRREVICHDNIVIPGTVEPHSNGPATNGISPRTDSSSLSLHCNFFCFVSKKLSLPITEKNVSPLKSVRAGFHCNFFLVSDTQLYKSLYPSIRWSVGPLVREHELKSVKTRISAPAHPSATGNARVSGLVFPFTNHESLNK